MCYFYTTKPKVYHDMKKIQSLLFALACAFGASAITPYALIPDETLPANSGFSKIEKNAENNSWVLTCTNNDFGNVRPTVQFKPLAEEPAKDLVVLAFDYRSTRSVGNFRISVPNAGKNGDKDFTKDVVITMPKGDTWRTVRVTIKANRTNPIYKLGLVGQIFKLSYMDLLPEATLELRNVRIEEDEVSPNLVTLARSESNFIEAEDFNTSVTTGKAFTAHQADRSQIAEYHNPVPGQFPIYAFTSAGYTVVNGSMEESARLLQKKYRDMWDAGFNITEGTAWPGVDAAALWPDREINGAYCYLFEGTGLKMMLRAGMDNNNDVLEVVGAAKTSPNIAGYCIKDEPHCKDFADTRTKLERVRAVDNDHLLYGNLLHINTPPGAIGATSYDNYVERYINETCMGLFSYDYYGVRCTDPKDETKVELQPNFFMNLEIISKFSKAYHKPFWAFTRASSSGWHTVEGVMGAQTYKYPVPTEEWMRVQAFAALLYGAQGLQYWPYTSCDDGDQAPIDNMGNLSNTYYYAKHINADVKALTWVFLGAELLHAGHTNAVTPVGCQRVNAAMLPQGVTAVASDGSGVAVGVLQNGKNVFVMVLNADIHNAQTATVTLDKSMKQVLVDGTTQEVAAGTKTHELRPGSFVIYLADENAAELDTYASTPGTHSNYRIDSPEVAVSAHSSASNGHYIADMGSASWNIYSLITPEDPDRIITAEQAAENWGASFNYTFDVPEDMDANLYIGHCVPWGDYGRVASVGAKPGLSYTVEGNPTLNWPKQYAASMILYVDDKEVVPANQPKRPAVPETFTEDGAEFNRILADENSWVSTANADGSASNVLYFWPAQGGSNDLDIRYNDKPDYQDLHLSAGTHKITVKSLSYPWHFDNIKIDTVNASGLETIAEDSINYPVEWYDLQGRSIDPAKAAHGVYIRRQGAVAKKVVL